MFAAGKTAGVSNAVNYIEDVFSTYLFTGNSTTNTITNGIDLSTYGGLLWTKSRSNALTGAIYDSAIGLNKYLIPSSTALANANTGVTFNTNGFTVGANDNANSTTSAVSWTFRKQPKFFDVVTYTGTGSARTVAHSLGSAPGCIMVKRTDTTSGWNVYHRSLTSAAYELELNTTSAQFSDTTIWNSTAPTSSVFSVGTNGGVNASGGTYVAYLFAHDAGGFGLTGTDNVISCGSYTGNGSTSGPTVTLGYEPQWLLIKRTDTTSNWSLMDNMRGLTAKGSDDFVLFPNTSGVETYYSDGLAISATGFQLTSTNAPINASGGTYIYIAIRRGPMKVPTDATRVFAPALQNASSTAQTKSYGFTTDSVLAMARNSAGYSDSWWSRLQGANRFLSSQLTDAENTSQTTALIGFDAQTGVRIGVDSGSWIQATANWIHYAFQRAPNFFDAVCYTGTGTSNSAKPHNLGVEPELILIKRRDTAENWPVYCKYIDATAPWNYSLGYLNGTGAKNSNSGLFGSQLPTSANFYTAGNNTLVNTSGATYVAYLFATCAGVSKVGSYSGTGATQTIDCGFTGGARFVLVKRTDTTGNWYVWDTARGMTAGTDPSLLLNSTAAEVNANSIYTTTGGFQIVSTAAGINASGGAYIYLAIS